VTLNESRREVTEGRAGAAPVHRDSLGGEGHGHLLTSRRGGQLGRAADSIGTWGGDDYMKGKTAGGAVERTEMG